MGRYYDLVKANFNKLRNDDKVMWGSIELWDKHLEEMLPHHPDKYWEIMRDTHEMMYGKHFDREYAEWQVEQMHHKCGDKMHKGEHWSHEETTQVMQKYRPMLSPEITPCDFYVALNAQWHDYHCWLRGIYATEEEVDLAIIESAVVFWFKDEDYDGNDKVWVYFRK